MLSSETAGSPFGKFAATAFCFEPAAMSVTVPRITIGAPTDVTGSGAVTVVSLGPFPKQYTWLSYPLNPTR